MAARVDDGDRAVITELDSSHVTAVAIISGPPTCRAQRVGTARDGWTGVSV